MTTRTLAVLITASTAFATTATTAPASEKGDKVFNIHANYQLSEQCSSNARGVKLTEIVEAASVGGSTGIALLACNEAQPLEDCATKYGAFTISVGGGAYDLPIITKFTCQKK